MSSFGAGVRRRPDSNFKGITVTEANKVSDSFRAARDHLIAHREDYETVASGFRFPDVGRRFNWAIDWFDHVARGNPRMALRIVGDDGSDESYSFDEIAQRSDRIARWLADGGVAPGDRVMLMLGNQVELLSLIHI